MAVIQKPHSELATNAVEAVLAEQRRSTDNPDRMGGLEFALTAFTPAITSLIEQYEDTQRKLALCVEVQERNQQTYFNQTEYERAENARLKEQVHTAEEQERLAKEVIEGMKEQLEASRKDASRLRGLIDAGLGREQALQEQLEKLKKDYDDLRDHRVVLVNSSTTQNDESRPEGRPS